MIHRVQDCMGLRRATAQGTGGDGAVDTTVRASVWRGSEKTVASIRWGATLARLHFITWCTRLLNRAMRPLDTDSTARHTGFESKPLV